MKLGRFNYKFVVTTSINKFPKNMLNRLDPTG